MDLHRNTLDGLEPATAACYRQAVQTMQEAGVPFLVGGAYALAIFTGIIRHTKDFDIFVRPKDSTRALEALAAAGYRTELTFAHWLGKAFHRDDFIDVIFSSGNGVARVDDEWFTHAIPAEVLGVPVNLCPVEETIWSKGFVMERERFDGADIMHLIRSRGAAMDWPRLLRRYGENWRVLLSHLALFGYVYPGEKSRVPSALMNELLGRLEREGGQEPAADRVCRGPLLSREQYLPDIEQWGYRDARQQPAGPMTEGQIARWTEAIAREK